MNSGLANPIVLREEAWLWFNRDGDTVDDEVVSETVKPSVDPTSNWPSVGCVQECNIVTETRRGNERRCPQPGGGWLVKDDVLTDRFYVQARFEESNDIVRQLRYGLAAKIVNGTSQAPVGATENAIYGWLKGSILNLGTLVDKFDIRCKVTLEEQPTIQGDAQFPVLRFEMIVNDENAITPVS